MNRVTSIGLGTFGTPGPGTALLVSVEELVLAPLLEGEGFPGFTVEHAVAASSKALSMSTVRRIRDCLRHA
ncbi:hypothetical protein GCM10027258_13350 [Amycolatopsis stemonae]